MNPTLREPVLLEVRPYYNQSIHRGDVIYFINRDGITAMVHRVIAVNVYGVITRGDNNHKADDGVLPFEKIIGKITTAWSGSKSRTVLGGRQGELLGLSLYALKCLEIKISPLFSPIYHLLCKSGFFFHILPLCFQPKVIHFQSDSGVRLFLFWGGMMIGRYENEKRQWLVRRPFRLILNDSLLIAATLDGDQVKTEKNN